MSKYGELLALAEIFKKQGAEEAKAKLPMRTDRKKDDKVDLMALLEKKRQEYLAVKNFVDEQHKLNKPEEKKEDKMKWKLEHIAMFLIATSPITGPLYVWWFRSLLGT